MYEETTELSALSASLKTSDTADLNIAIISLLEYFGKDEDVVYLINQIENYTKYFMLRFQNDKYLRKIVNDLNLEQKMLWKVKITFM